MPRSRAFQRAIARLSSFKIDEVEKNRHGDMIYKNTSIGKMYIFGMYDTFLESSRRAHSESVQKIAG